MSQCLHSRQEQPSRPPPMPLRRVELPPLLHAPVGPPMLVPPLERAHACRVRFQALPRHAADERCTSQSSRTAKTGSTIPWSASAPLTAVEEEAAQLAQ